jgi:hypothetical protein
MEESETGPKEASKQGAYSGAKCRTVEIWFPVYVNYFVKCICIQKIRYS